jgi:predicted enzyme related to lactoylglutathione lyase
MVQLFIIIIFRNVMANVVNWFEIPVADFDRAKKFYSNILAQELQDMDTGASRMGIIPTQDGVGGAIVCGEGYVPSEQGALIYLNGGSDLNTILSKVEEAGGRVIMPKWQISPEIGHMAMFHDTEGNRLALHSIG